MYPLSPFFFLQLHIQSGNSPSVPGKRETEIYETERHFPMELMTNFCIHTCRNFYLLLVCVVYPWCLDCNSVKNSFLTWFIYLLIYVSNVQMHRSCDPMCFGCRSFGAFRSSLSVWLLGGEPFQSLLCYTSC